MKVIVGLGNPGKKYQKTRHNIGFIILESFCGEVKWQKKHKALLWETIIDGERVLFIKPQTYMNTSGVAVKKAIKNLNIEPTDILIIHDDLDLEFGRYKLKKDSSSGGHNGIKSIIEQLQSDAFARLKIGISNNKMLATKDYVLSTFSSQEIKEIELQKNMYNEIIKSFILEGLDIAMNKYNKK